MNLPQTERLPSPQRLPRRGVAASFPSPTTHAMLGFAADWPLLKKVQTIDRFLGQDYFHENGMMYCMWRGKDDELRPYRDEDFAGTG